MVFSHVNSPIKGKHGNMVVYYIVELKKILYDCVRELRGSVVGFLQVVSIHFDRWHNNKGLAISMWM